MPLARNRLASLTALAALCFCLTGCSATVSIPKERPVSAAQQAKLLAADRENALEQLRAQYPDAKPPTASVKKLVAPKEWASTLSNCMNRAGFDTRVQGGGVAYSSLPKEQQETYALAFYVCSVEYPIDPVDSAPLSTAEMRFLYSYLTGPLTNCLKEHGASVSSPPSEQTFADSYSSTGGWTPYSGVTDVSQAEWAKLNKACPQQPAGFRGN